MTCILWAFDNPEMANQTYEIGGSEYFPLRQVVETIMEVNQRAAPSSRSRCLPCAP